jgi:hypothetical protein
MTRKRISKRNAKHSKTYKGGASKTEVVKPTIPIVEDTAYDIKNDTYPTLVSKFESKLELNDREVKSILGKKTKPGFFSYLLSMERNLWIRPKLLFNEVIATGVIVLDKKKTQTFKILDEFRNNIINIRRNYNTLYSEFDGNDTEIVFHVIIGCMQKLYKHLCDFLLFLPSKTFPKYTTDLKDKSFSIAQQIEELKETEYLDIRTMGGVEFVPIKIGNNTAMYEVWEEKKIMVPDKDPDYNDQKHTIETCLSWRVKHNYNEKEMIFAEPYYDSKLGCKSFKEREKITEESLLAKKERESLLAKKEREKEERERQEREKKE